MSDDNAPSGETIAGDIKVTEEAKQKASEMMEAYEDRPTAVLPGSHNTVTGTAVNEWLDDDGNPKYGKDEQPDTEK